MRAILDAFDRWSLNCTLVVLSFPESKSFVGPLRRVGKRGLAQDRVLHR